MAGALKRSWLPATLVGGTVLAAVLFGVLGAGGEDPDVREFVAPNGRRYRVRHMGSDLWSAEVHTGATASGFEFLQVELMPFDDAKQAALDAAMTMGPP